MPRRTTAAAPPAPVAPAAAWSPQTILVGADEITLVSKPGVFAHPETDPGAVLLARHADFPAAACLLHFQCGAGLAGVVAARRHPRCRVVLTDRDWVATEAARRTVAANGLFNAEVHLAHGLWGVCLDAPADAVFVRLPRDKASARQLLWDAFNALNFYGVCLLAGANDEGIRPAVSVLEQLFGTAETVAHYQGHRLARAVKTSATPAAPAAFREPWLDPAVFQPFTWHIREHHLQLFFRPGVFAWERLDPGTALLAEFLDVPPGAAVLDLGCGAGALGLLAARLGAGRVVLVDSDVEAVRCANRALTANGLSSCTALASDGADAVADQHFDLVVSNPPFHVGRRAGFDTTAHFLAGAKGILRPGGRLLLVANRHLPYERPLRDTFGAATILCERDGYKILAAVQPG